MIYSEVRPMENHSHCDFHVKVREILWNLEQRLHNLFKNLIVGFKEQNMPTQGLTCNQIVS